MDTAPIAPQPTLGDALRALADELDTTEPWQLDDAGKLARHATLRATIARLEHHDTTLIADIEATGAARRLGHRDTRTWLTTTGTSPGEAKATLAVATALTAGELTALATAWAAGQVHAGHARMLHRCLTGLRAHGADPASLQQAEEILTAQAHHLDPHALARVATHLRLTLTPTDTHRADDPDTRTLTLALALALAQTTGGISVLTGELDTEGAAILTTALNAFTVPDDPDGPDNPDERLSPAQRRGQALVRMAQTAMGATTTQGSPTTLLVTIAWQDLKNGTGSGATEWTEDLPITTVRRMACDAGLVPAVLAGSGEPLDLGRTIRAASPGQRRALRVRDGGCVFPGCDRPPAHTEAHHIRHWAEGGPTDLDNLVLLCSRHHHDVHARGWTVTLDEHRIAYLTPPTRIDPRQRPRYHHRFHDRRRRRPEAA
ncbi:DUF222 domain-containing protein [Kineococcus gynurae]|uniref:DUF222 domain-containing protein n=1 Tax=Kineococcus gynurae TaxID=452979 RepID=A0ABV5LUQ2_9ACTN